MDWWVDGWVGSWKGGQRETLTAGEILTQMPPSPGKSCGLELGWCTHNCSFGQQILNHYIVSNTSLLIKIGAIIINTFLPMRKKFAYSCMVKSHASGFKELLESIFCILLVVEVFSLKKSCWDAWRSGSWLVRGQLKMVDEAKLGSPVHSTFEALVVQYMVECCHGEELSPFYWTMLAESIVVFGASHWFAEHSSQM